MVHPIGKKIFKIIMKPYIKEVTGLENTPKDKGLIIAVNHESYMDHVIVSTVFVNYLNKKVHFLSKTQHFDSFFKKKFHKWADAIPIERGKGGVKTLRLGVNALKEGKVIAIHPEGMRTLTGKMVRAHTGVARLALNAKVPVLPVGLIGTFEMLPKGKYIPRFKRATMNIGKVMYFDEYYKKENDKNTLRLVTNKIMKEIAKLAKQRYDYD